MSVLMHRMLTVEKAEVILLILRLEEEVEVFSL